MKQHYDLYKEEDFEVWQTLCNRQMSQLTNSASATYLAGLKKINFSAIEIPKFNKINQKLKVLTKWELVVVPGLIPDLTFFELMSNKKFPATTWLRKKSELDYLEEPDMFHDVFAHVPRPPKAEIPLFSLCFCNTETFKNHCKQCISV